MEQRAKSGLIDTPSALRVQRYSYLYDDASQAPWGSFGRTTPGQRLTKPTKNGIGKALELVRQRSGSIDQVEPA